MKTQETAGAATTVGEDMPVPVEHRVRFSLVVPLMLEGVFTSHKYDIEKLMYLIATMLDAGVSVKELQRRLVPREEPAMLDLTELERLAEAAPEKPMQRLDGLTYYPDGFTMMAFPARAFYDAAREALPALIARLHAAEAEAGRLREALWAAFSRAARAALEACDGD
jgi:hypothetical protein